MISIDYKKRTKIIAVNWFINGKEAVKSYIYLWIWSFLTYYEKIQI